MLRKEKRKLKKLSKSDFTTCKHSTSILLMWFNSNNRLLAISSVLKNKLREMNCIYAGISETGVINEPSLSDKTYTFSSGIEKPPTEYKSRPKACFGSFRKTNINASTILIGKYVMFDRVELSGMRPLYLGTCYLPCLQNSTWTRECEDNLFQELIQYIDELSKKGEIMVGGDFNATIPLAFPGAHADTTTDPHQKKIQRGERLSHLFKHFNLSVVNNMLPDNAEHHTWIKPFKGKLKTSILDYVICSNNLTQYIDSFSILDESFASDHCMLQVRLSNLPSQTKDHLQSSIR